jgi:hypothetical protein
MLLNGGGGLRGHATPAHTGRAARAKQVPRLSGDRAWTRDSAAGRQSEMADQLQQGDSHALFAAAAVRGKEAGGARWMLSGARLPHLDIACCASVPCCCVSRPLPTLDAKCTLAASAAAGAMPSQDGRKRWRSQSEGTRAGDDGRGDVARSSAGGRASRRPSAAPPLRTWQHPEQRSLAEGALRREHGCGAAAAAVK